jgi:hypothetical protein
MSSYKFVRGESGGYYGDDEARKFGESDLGKRLRRTFACSEFCVPFERFIL